MTDVDANYLIDTGTEKGEELLLKHADVEMATTEHIRQLGQVLSAKWPHFRSPEGQQGPASVAATSNYGAKLGYGRHARVRFVRQRLPDLLLL